MPRLPSRQLPAAAGLNEQSIGFLAVQSVGLSDFFEPPPKPDVLEPQRYRMPPWFGAPRGTIPGVVVVELVLARTEHVAVCVTHVAAYPVGFEFEFVTMSAEDDQGMDPMMFHRHHRLGQPAGDGIPPEMLRLGVQFADGSKATNTGGFHHDGNPPAGPVMRPCGGGGGGGNWSQTQWVWPLPPPGPVLLVCEWPAMNIPLTRGKLDAQIILDAAARAQVIFSEEHLPEPPSGEDGSGPFIR